MRFRIHRSVAIRCPAPVREHHLEWRCAPWDDAGQRLHRLAVTCTPQVDMASHRDCFGNQVHRTALLGAHDGLLLAMDADVETLLDDPFACERIEPAREREWISASLREAPRLWDLVLHRDAASPLLQALVDGADATELGVDARMADALPVLRPGVALFAQLQDANTWLTGTCASLRLDVTAGATAEDASADRPLREARGTPAELAMTLAALARSWGLPARLVSGYHSEPPAADGAGLHHWAEVLVPGAGWRGLDPSAGRVADAAYVRLAVGRTCQDLRPLRQSWQGEADAAPQPELIRIEAGG
ncbi:transglutaminase family protein [uncultured Thiohalocapsa sp.]|uniref:transglutaminase family protein n=1 Tax=uncultured Thiohalocapsa sp. TaxID=768990 RepID=UPI0025CFCCF7|nr:transglutaminase family protein [uncultured Thiohalocapsa sp.]